VTDGKGSAVAVQVANANRNAGWAHNYIHQTNQPFGDELDTDDNPWFNVNNYGLAYGLEPNYVSSPLELTVASISVSLTDQCSIKPCCTVNHPQGLPKFIAQAYGRHGDDGLVHALLGPARVQTQVQGSDVSGELSSLTEETESRVQSILNPLSS
jgi:hypothetical protein